RVVYTRGRIDHVDNEELMSYLDGKLEERVLFRRAAMFWLRQEVERHFKTSSAKIRPLYDETADRLTLRARPDDLRAALWLQFLTSIDGKRDYRTCAQCRAWFEVSLEPTGARKSREFCKDGCRHKAYRDRRDRARELRRGGMALRKIARELGSDLSTV